MVSVHPGFAPALNQLGIQYLKLSRADKATEVLGAAVKSAPDEYEPRLNYGIALFGLKKFAEAEKQLTAALKKNSSAPTAHMFLGMVLLNLRKLDDAQKELETAVRSDSAEVSQAIATSVESTGEIKTTNELLLSWKPTSNSRRKHRMRRRCGRR